ncbi:unnamed protein product, partial [Amoebophrya sp. A25]|eukprot:GSA25T00006962001.1
MGNHNTTSSSAIGGAGASSSASSPLPAYDVQLQHELSKIHDP